MRRGQFLVGLLIGAFVGGILSVWLVLPNERSAKSGFMFDASVDEVWAVFTDPGSQASWRDDIKSVDVISATGERKWVEHPQYGPSIQFTETMREQYRRLSIKMDAENAFTGQYTAEFEERDGGRTMAYISESVQLKGFLPKIMSYLFVNQRDFTWQYCINAQAEIERRRGRTN